MEKLLPKVSNNRERDRQTDRDRDIEREEKGREREQSKRSGKLFALKIKKNPRLPIITKKRRSKHMR